MAADAVLFLSRLLLALLFLPSAIATLRGIDGAAAYFAGLGLPMPLVTAWGTGLFELIAGVLIVVGGQTRNAAAALALFCLATAWIGHHGQDGDDATLAMMHWQAMMKDIAISGGFLALAVAGPGRWSIDRWRG